MGRSHRENEAYADAHGRSATSPTDIPSGGWKDILWRVYQRISRDRVLLVAAGVAFYLLLAFVPSLAALISLYGLFADPATISEHVSLLSGLVPDGAMEIIGDQLTRLSAQGETKLGFTSAISIAVALWSANAGVKALFEAMNVAYDEEEKRSFLKLNLISLAFTLSILVAIILFFGVAVVLPMIFRGLGQNADLLVRIASIAALAILLVTALGVLYRWGPSRETAKWRWITPGAVLTILVTAIVSVLFSWYVANFGSYNATYGSLGTVVGFMTWIWITMIILVCGAELNSEAEHQTARDSTTGPEQPLGTRGARMADRIGESYDGGEASGQQRPLEQPGLRATRSDQEVRTDREPRVHPRAARSYEAPVSERQTPRPREGVSLTDVVLVLPLAIAVAWMTRR